MAGEIATSAMPNLYELQKASDFGDKKADNVFGQGFNFLPRLQLYGSQTEEVKAGNFPMAEWGIVKFGEEKVIQAGKTLLVNPIAYRTKAMSMKTIDGKPLSYFDQDSVEFKEVRRTGDANPKSGNVYGPEFLLWAGPEFGFITYFMNNITSRNEAPSVRALCPRADGSWKTGLLSIILIKKEAENQSWHGPKVAPSAQMIEGPDPSVVEPLVAMFLKPVASVAKAVTAAPAGAAASSDER